MKTPRRSFVVEYKSNRRPAKAGPKSIWGNLDLQAVSRAVEADGILPMEGPRPEDLSSQETIDATPFVPSCSAGNDDPVDTSASAMAAEDRHVPAVDDAPSAASSTGATANAAARQSSPSEVKGRARPRRSKGKTRETPSGDPSVTEDAVAEHDLAALERENRRLKTLVIAKIRTENAWLASRLSRFDPR